MQHYHRNAGQTTGGLPQAMLVRKFDETNLDNFDRDDSLNQMMRAELKDRSMEEPYLESDEPNRNPSRFAGKLNLRLNGTRGYVSDQPKHPELFLGFADTDDWGVMGVPNLRDLRRHTEHRIEKMVNMSDSANQHVVDRPWTDPDISRSRVETMRRQKYNTKVFQKSYESHPTGLGPNFTGDTSRKIRDQRHNETLMSQTRSDISSQYRQDTDAPKSINAKHSSFTQAPGGSSESHQYMAGTQHPADYSNVSAAFSSDSQRAADAKTRIIMGEIVRMTEQSAGHSADSNKSLSFKTKSMSDDITRIHQQSRLGSNQSRSLETSAYTQTYESDDIHAMRSYAGGDSSFGSVLESSINGIPVSDDTGRLRRHGTTSSAYGSSMQGLQSSMRRPADDSGSSMFAHRDVIDGPTAGLTTQSYKSTRPTESYQHVTEQSQRWGEGRNTQSYKTASMTGRRSATDDPVPIRNQDFSSTLFARSQGKAIGSGRSQIGMIERENPTQPYFN